MEPWKGCQRADAREFDAFVDLILDDPDLLAAEFEAIVGDCWSAAPPGAVPRCANGAREPRRPRRWFQVQVTPASDAAPVARRLGRTRQRSPPTAT